MQKLRNRERGRAACRARWSALISGAALLAVLLAGAVLPVRAEKNAPEGVSLSRAIPAQTLCFPLETDAWRVSDPYGWRDDPFTGQKAFHRGVDLACAEGSRVLAAMGGVITSARRSSSYGNCVRISHPDGQETLYAHMQYLFVSTGAVVTAGQVLGVVGETGNATGPHLHFEILHKGLRYDPAQALQDAA